MSTYENAPSTKMLATHCCACGRALRDAVSVEAGMGPDCRERHGYGEPQAPADWDVAEQVMLAAETDGDAQHEGYVAVVSEARGTQNAHRAANVLVHHAACVDRSERKPFVATLAALGFHALASALARAAGEMVSVEGPVPDARGPRYVVRQSRFDRAFADALYAARIGARWDRERKAYLVPADARAQRELWRVMREHYAGAMLDANGKVRGIPAL